MTDAYEPFSDPPEITVNPNRISRDEDYMQRAEIIAKRSKANRLQVGAVLVKDNRVISDGYNGMPAGEKDDVCETWQHHERDSSHPPTMVTKREVLHAESNTLMKLARFGGTGSDGATIYTVYSPCFECAKLIKQAGIVRLVYRNEYRDAGGIKFLRDRGVVVDHLHSVTVVEINPPAPVPTPAPQPRPAPKPTPMLAEITGRHTAAQPAVPSPSVFTNIGVPDPARLNAIQFPPEDEVAALLRAHEASLKKAVPAPGAKPADPPDAPYRTSFI